MAEARNSSSCIEALIREYEAHLETLRYSAKTLATYGPALRDFVAAMRVEDPRRVTTRDIENYRGKLLEHGLKAASVFTYTQAVKLFFRYLEETQRVFVNPAAALAPMHRPRELQPVPTEEEMRVLLNAPDVSTGTGKRNRALLETAYSAGLRRAELCNLTVSCLDLEDGRVRVMGKGQRERVVPLGADAVRWLRIYLREVRAKHATEESGDALWITMTGRPLGYQALQEMVLRYHKASGISTHVGLHSLRRACATHMLRHGAPAASIRLLLGHSSMRHLSEYLRVTISDLKKAHEQSRLGQ